MRALVVHPGGTLEYREIDDARPGAHQALVKTISGGVCGTDNSLVRGLFKGVGAEQYPLVLGHESVGRVVEIGKSVVSFVPGDIVMLPFLPNPTEDGRSLGSAWGAFSEFALVDDFWALDLPAGVIDRSGVAPAQTIVPQGIDPVFAPVIVTLREVLSSIQVSGIDVGHPILVYGSGPVAMAFVKLLKILGAPQTISVVRSSQKAALMSDFGADLCIDTSVDTVPDVIARVAPDGVPAVIDAVGQPDIMNEALGLLQDRGILFCYGVPKANSMNLDWERAPYNWSLKFQQMPRKDEEGACHDQIVEWALGGIIDLRDFVSEIVPITEAPEFFPKYLAGATNKKIIFKF